MPLNYSIIYKEIGLFRFVPELSSTPVVQWLSYSPLDPRFAGSIPVGVDGFFKSVNILSMTYFGREVKH